MYYVFPCVHTSRTKCDRQSWKERRQASRFVRLILQGWQFVSTECELLWHRELSICSMLIVGLRWAGSWCFLTHKNNASQSEVEVKWSFQSSGGKLIIMGRKCRCVSFYSMVQLKITSISRWKCQIQSDHFWAFFFSARLRCVSPFFGFSPNQRNTDVDTLIYPV